MDPGLTTLSGPKFSLQAPLLELKVDSRQRRQQVEASWGEKNAIQSPQQPVTNYPLFFRRIRGDLQIFQETFHPT